ncbi:MAG: hypothetical protein QOK15_2643 [Nocardioidaceae bacterium]|jgi:hypothetical protein|nr:hypothetical protein [Nocardioidaceae bacterium]
MASPFSGWVLVGGVVLGSPALKEALVDGTMPLPTAGVRVAIAMLFVWIGLSLLEWLLGQTAEPTRAEPEPPRALPGINGPVPVRPASIDPPGDQAAG